jgi:hypothetical protein
MGKWMMVFVMGLLMVGCSSILPTGQSPTLTPPAVMPKLLATVFPTPLPNPEEQEATRIASLPTQTPFVAPTLTPTAYVGVFLGEAENPNGDGPVIDPAALQLPTDAPPFGITPTASCPAIPDPLFGTRWQSDPQAISIGCPIEQVASFQGTLQIFERGVMYYWPNGEIWAIAPSAQRFWYATSAPPMPPQDNPAPEGLLSPALGFGAVWRGVPGVQDALGWAVTNEESTTISVQALQNGDLLADGGSGQIFVLLADGRAFGPFQP